MEGLRCPICKAITLVQSANDGDFFTCPFCNYRYTITSVRRYYLEPQTADNYGELNLNHLEHRIKNLKNEQLAEIMQIVSKELSRRLSRKKECLLVK
ncbi:MAG: hypothetical protein GXW85_01045 [Clostridia bacterium]|nr:hypothetical protein [Clostridia bacterium]